MSYQNSPKGFFITGTDTGVGKTTATSLLISQLQSLGYKAMGCKPVAAGSVYTNKGFRHEDGLLYQNVNSIKLEYEKINPILFEQPISPNIAAKIEQKEISIQSLYEQLQEIFSLDYDYLFVEGVGGWKVPLDQETTMADLARLINFPIILVVGIRLGCLNHALLTWDSLMRDGVKVAGWIANIIEPNTLLIEDNISTLVNRIPCPFLGEIAYFNSESKQEQLLDLSAII